MMRYMETIACIRLFRVDMNVSDSILDLKKSSAAKSIFPNNIKIIGTLSKSMALTLNPPKGFFPKLSNRLFTSLFIIFLLFV